VLEVLVVCARHNSPPAAVVKEMLRLRGDMGGDMPGVDAVRLATASHVVVVQGEAMLLTAAGASVLRMARAGQSIEARRVLLARLIKQARRDLLALALITPREVEAFGDPEVVQCLSELSLLKEPMSPEALEWWRSLRAVSADVDDSYLKMLGDRAEELSMRFEQRRLEQLGRADLADRVVWVSRFDEGAGYDILSRVGIASDQHDAEIPLRVEAKACGRAVEGFRFFFSRNEWNVSRSSDAPYVIHLWSLSDMDSGRDAPTAVLLAAQVHAWLPVDNLPTGTWVDSCVCPPEVSLGQ